MLWGAWNLMFELKSFKEVTLSAIQKVAAVIPLAGSF